LDNEQAKIDKITKKMNELENKMDEEDSGEKLDKI